MLQIFLLQPFAGLDYWVQTCRQVPDVALALAATHMWVDSQGLLLSHMGASAG